MKTLTMLIAFLTFAGVAGAQEDYIFHGKDGIEVISKRGQESESREAPFIVYESMVIRAPAVITLNRPQRINGSDNSYVHEIIVSSGSVIIIRTVK